MIYIYRIKLVGWFLGIFIIGMLVGLLGFKAVFFIGAALTFVYWYYYNEVEDAQERRERRNNEIRQ